jgi:Na+/H+-dicarboxylate symporter
MWEKLRNISLTRWILIGMAIGVLIGWLAPDAAQQLRVPAAETLLP